MPFSCNIKSSCLKADVASPGGIAFTPADFIESHFEVVLITLRIFLVLDLINLEL